MLIVCSACAVNAQWDIPEDVPLGSARVIYKGYKDIWVVTFDDGAPLAYTYLVPQLCRAEASECSHGQIIFSHLTCASINTLLLESSWFNENAATDIVDNQACPKSFADAHDAQVLMGSVMPEPFVYVSVPTALTVHNNETLLARFDRGGSSAEWRLHVRLLFLSEMHVGSERVFTVRRYVAQVLLKKPDVALATLSVQSPCAYLGLRAPRDAQLSMRMMDSPVCVWTCRVDAMRTPWNAAPTETGVGDCRPLHKYFTAVEFAFTLDTLLRGATPSRLSPSFLDELDRFAAHIEAALADGGAMVALTVPGSDFDTVVWREWIYDFIAFAHRSDAVIAHNSSLVVDALRALGRYTEVVNPVFTYSGAGRRYSVQDITVKGLWFSEDVTTNVRSMWSRLQTTVAHLPHAFAPEMQVQSVAQVDVARVHRVALPYTNESAVEERMQKDAVQTVVMLCFIALVMVVCMHRWRSSPQDDDY